MQTLFSEFKRKANEENKNEKLKEETDKMKVQLNNKDIFIKELKLNTQKD